MKNRLIGKDILRIEKLSKTEITQIWNQAAEYERLYKTDRLPLLQVMKGLVLATVFAQPSTRTRLSFESAMLRLGGQVISIADSQTSSLAKGESFLDTGRVVGGTADSAGLADVIVCRSAIPKSVDELARGSLAPVISGGQGTDQHPTQAILDGKTIIDERRRIQNLSFCFMGDLKNGRTVHSLLPLISKWPNNTVYLVSPEGLRMPKEILAKYRSQVRMIETSDVRKIIQNCDVLYCTRVQKEYMTKEEQRAAEREPYFVDMNLIEYANKQRAEKDRITILHPLPRVDELRIEPEKYKPLAIFRQAANGIWTRAAELALITGRV